MKRPPLQDLKDEQLLTLMKKGNELAFTQLFDRYWAALLDSAIKILREQNAAEDCVQDVFADFWKKREVLNIRNPKAYLYQSIKYKVIDQIRTKRLSLLHLEVAEMIMTANTTEETIQYNELRTVLDTSISELPEQCKRIFKMSRFERMSNREIAERLNLSVRTVENHISHAIRLLRSKVEPANVLLILMLLSQR